MEASQPSSFNSQPYHLYWVDSPALGARSSGSFSDRESVESHQDLFKWATKNTALACENLMIAAEAVGLNTCPMEGFETRRSSW